MDVLAGRASSTPLPVTVRRAEYWREALADAPEPLELPADRPRPAQPDHAASVVRLELDAEATAALGALASRHGATLSTTLLAGWAAVLGRLSGQTDLVIGCFENPLPVRVDLSGSPTGAELLRRVEARVRAASRNADLPFDRLVELAQADGAAAAPLFRAAFAWRDAPGSGPEPRSTGGLDLWLELREEGGGIAGEVVFATALFERETVERYTGYLRRILAGMAADETRPVDRLPLLSDEERRRVVEEWNRTAAPYPTDSYIHERFEAQAGRTPDAVAVVHEERELTYGELNRRANRLAHHLRELGVGPDARVGICVERGPELMVAVLGVLKAGGAYLPLDPGYPRERLLDMVRDSAPVVMLTHGSLAERLAGLDVPLLSLDDDAAWWQRQPATDPERAALTPEHLTYVIYTSGSTGRPKGVEMTHRGASNLLHWYLGATRISERDAVLVVTSFSFHLTQRNLLAPLFVGGRVHLAREPFEPRRIAAQIVASGITMMNVTPTGFQALVEADGGRAIGGVRIVVFGGEPLYPRQLARVPEPRPVFLNPYGATEATGITAHHFARADLASYSSRSMPPGRPIANARIYVLDGAGEPVPVGVTGELYLGGAGVTRGYRALPGHTAERFLPDPFGAEPGARLYRTGDLGRWLPDGTIEFMGRGDAQVKVRGFRIELGEIEARLAEHAAVHETVVVARDGEVGDPRLVAYYVGADAGAAALRAHLAARLPEYMIPAAFVHMDALPVNPNGKLDRKALPAPDFASVEERYVAPRTPVEEVLAGIWAEVLGVERMGVEESFFELGGHSLLATRVVSRVRELFGVELPLRALFEGPTVAEMARRVEEMRRAGLPVLPPVVPAGRTGALPLSFAQERLWFIDRLEPGSEVYNIPVAWRLAGALDVAALERALGEIVRRHEALRTVFREVDGSPVQIVAPPGGFALAVEDLSGVDEAAVGRRAGEEARRAFDLAAGPLFRAALLRLGAEDHVLLLTVHHIVSDGWSMGVLYRELSALYAAYREGRSSPLPELPVQYADHALWQREHLRDGVLDRQLAYWRERLADAPALLELPTDHPRPAVQTFRGGHERIELPGELLARLEALGRSEGATLYMTLLGAFQVLLSRYGGSEDVVVGSPIAGRTRKEVEELIGFFVNTLVLRTDLSADPTFREVLGRVREATLGAYEHQEVPFERLVAELQPERSLSHTPLFQVMFTLRNAGAGSGALPGLEVSEFGAELASAKFDLSLVIDATARGLRLGLNYRTDLFERGTIQRMLGHLARVLEQVAADADARISRLELLDEAERARLLALGEGATPDFPRATVDELFAHTAAAAPEAVALASDGGRMTYAELDRRANRLAHHLRRAGVAAGTRVGVCLERGPEMVVATLAALKAGGAYVPLDPAYPAERLAFMLADTAVPVLVTESPLADRLPPHAARVVRVDTDAAAIAAEPADAPAAGTGPEAAAYVMYTSGSTGHPKGVEVAHRGIVRLVRGQDFVSIDPSDVFLQLAPASFDGATLELWGPLLNGARLALHPAAQPTVESIGRAVAEHGVTVLWLTAGLFHLVVEERIEILRGVRQLLAGGDVLSVPHVRRALAELPETALTNGYGPTENTTATCCHRIGAAPEAGASIPVGRPVANTYVRVLDAGMRPAPVGVPGELYAGGAGLALGYLNRPELTAEKFVADPFAAGARLYRTGDRVRWRADGTVEFLGRVDTQAKIRGFRVEPGEVEAVLRAGPGVREAAVVVRDDTAGDRRLVAYVAGDVADDEVREHLRARLPEHMLPAAIVRLDALPLTANGKLDRRALPAPDFASAGERYVAPRTPVEEVLAGIWAEVLRLERVGVEESFFDLGGHSLLGTRVISRVRELFGVELPLRALFEGPTVAEMAGRVEEIRRAGLPVLPPVVPTGRAGPLPLSFAQERLWLIDRMEPGSAVYNIPVAWRLAGALDATALERALGEIVRRHESLRTVFAEVDDLPVQVVAPFGGFALPVEDLSGLGEADREAAVGRRAGEEAARAFDLAAGPLFRAALLRLDAEDHVLLLSMHHIVSDGWSMGVLFRELSALYEAYREGAESPLPELEVQYADHAAWQREQVEGVVLERQLRYWRERLAGAPELLELPTDHPRPPVQTYRGATIPVELPLELLERLRALGRSEGATLYMTLLGAFQVLLSKYGGSEDVVVGSPIAGRTRKEVEELIGFFVNTLVLRTDLSGDPTFRETLRRVREATLGAYEHQEVPFERLVAELQPKRSLSHSPLFQVMFALQNTGVGGASLPGLSVSGIEAERASAKFDLSLALTETAEGLRGALNYSTDLFDRGTMERMLGHLARVLEQVAGDADVRLSRLELLDGAERDRVLASWNRTSRAYPDTPLHELFAEHARRAPDAPALRFRDETLRYGELDRRAGAIARRLRAEGVGPEVRVGILAEPGPDLVAGVLGILRAGGAYLPLDPAYPAERLAFMLDDARAPVVLAQPDLLASLPPTRARIVALEMDDGVDEDEPASGVLPENLAYVIYTSGSTGRPKGVLVEHRGLSNLVHHSIAALGMGPADTTLCLASVSFDIWVYQALVPLATGGAVRIVPREQVADVPALVEALDGVTTLHMVPALMRQVAATARDTHPAALPGVRLACTGGDVVSAELRAELGEVFPEAQVRVFYGPTEATVACSSHRVGEEGAGRNLIGAPFSNAAFYVVDAAGKPVPVGVPGELWIGGAGVTRGYLGRPALTAGTFVPDAFGGAPGGRLYRTGDRVRWTAEGELEFLGRTDTQVKIRGFRVEPGEIEAALRASPGVREAAVVLREDAAGDRRLVGYVVPADAPAAAELRAFLRVSLPEYMVPSAFVPLGAFPLTRSGKVDRRALPAPDASLLERAPEHVPPRTPAESAVARVWAEVLGVERIGAHDDFFALGGHSLLASRAVSRLRQEHGMELPLSAFFDHPTVEALAAAATAARPAVPEPALEALARGSGSLEDILAALEGLSQEEAEALLAAAEGA